MLKNIVIIVSTLLLFGCQTVKQINKMDAFPEMYSEKPITLLVVPVVNNTTAADAPDLYSATLKKSLTELGYYVLPIEYTQNVLKQQGITDGTVAREVPLEKYYEIFGADAVLFVTVNAWDTNYAVVASNMTVSSEFALYSTKSKNRIWSYNNSVVHNLTGNSGNVLVDIVATAVSTAVTEYLPIAESVNANIVSTMPKGIYNPKHGKDSKYKFFGVIIPYASNEANLKAKQFDEPKAGKSTVHIYRKASPIPTYQGIKRAVWLNDECIGSTATNSFFTIEVDTGEEYELSTQSELSNNTVDIQFTEDGNYYFEQVYTLGLVTAASSLKRRNEEVAQQDIKPLSLGLNGECDIE